MNLDQGGEQYHFRGKHILLKLSGEVLAGSDGAGISPAAVEHFVRAVQILADASLGVGLVIGGGNIFRGAQTKCRGRERVQGDYMGMMATIINALALKSAFDQTRVEAQLFTPFYLPAFSQSYSVDGALEVLKRSGVAIFAGGTGNPFCTTDSAAALRAAETNAFLLAKGTKVDGVYEKDPVIFSEAKRFEHLDYQKVIESNLKVMDLGAIALCRDSGIPVFVFSSEKLENFEAIAQGDWSVGTLVGKRPELPDNGAD